MMMFYITIFDGTLQQHVLHIVRKHGNNNITSLIKCIQFRLFNNACVSKSWLHAPIISLTASAASNTISHELRPEYGGLHQTRCNVVLCLWLTSFGNTAVQLKRRR
jgi:hypothetical protein